MWIKRGCCGLIDLRTQTMMIAGFYTLLATIGMIYGFVEINSPEKMMGASNEAVEGIIHEELETSADDNLDDDDDYLDASNITENNITTKIADGSISPHDRHHYEMALISIQKRGIKVVVGCAVSIVVSVMLFLGAKQGKSLFFIPWLTEQIVALCVGVIQSLIMAMGGFLMGMSIIGGIMGFCVFLISFFMIYSVLSHFFILRKMKQHSKDIINSVMTVGTSYQTTNYDRMTEELGREMTAVPPIRPRGGAQDDRLERDDVLYFSI